MNRSVLLVGAGGYGAGYAEQLIRGIPGVTFAGIVDPYVKQSSAWPLIEEHRIPCCDSIPDFFREHTATTAVIAAPIPFHEEYDVDLLNRGLDVLLEKPVSATMEQAERIKAARDASGKHLALGFQWCYEPAMRAFRADAVVGVYGKPVQLRALVNWPRAHSYYARGTGWAGKAYDAKGRPIFDSIAMNATAHYLMNMLWVADSPAVSCEAETARAYPVDTYDTAVLRYALKNGAVAHFVTSHVTDGNQDPMFVYEFENATAFYGGKDLKEGHILVRDKAGRIIRDYGFSETQYPGKLTRFLSCLEAGESPDCTLDDAMMHLSAIEMARAACPEAYTFPQAQWKEKDGFRCVPGLMARLRECFYQGKMPRELGGWTCGNYHVRFHYHTKEDVAKEAAFAGVEIPLAEDASALARPIAIAGVTLPNRIAVQPMEGADSAPDGSPTDLTFRRYLRFARGGAGIIWFEAVAIAPEVRSSPRQLMLTEENLPEFQRLIAAVKEEGLRANGFAPLIIMQLNLSGRYAKPDGTPHPLIAYNSRILEETPLPESCIVTDDQLKHYEELHGVSTRLAELAGFDGVDVKACHRYLASELLSAFDRPGEYGGCFENRARFLLNSVDAANAYGKNILVTTRMNAYDGFEFPWGYGVNPGEGIVPDFAEARQLAKWLYAKGERLIDVTIGNPYKNPHVNRPYDAGNYVPEEHPLFGVARLMDAVAAVKQAVPDATIVGSGFSYLRHLSPYLAAAMVESGKCDVAGFGRMAFACPDFANIILRGGELDEKQVCACCGGCAKLLRAGQPAGCILRDRKTYKAVSAK